MALHILRLPKLIAERRSSAIFGVVIIAMLWTGVLLRFSEDRQGDLKEAQRGNHNFAMVFEENVLRSIGEIDKALLYLRRTIETRKDSTDFATIVSTTDVLSEIIVQVAIIDAAGIMRASNVGPQPAPPLDLSDREHYKVHVNSNQDQLFMSKPVIGRASGKWSVQFSRRFLNRDKTFGGVVVASLDPDHFTRFYNMIDFASLASISLIGSDGVVRSSGGNAGGFALGQDLRGTRLLEHMRSGATSSTFEDTAQPNGEPCLITLRKVKGHPLWVSVTTNDDEIYKSSWGDFQVDALAAAALTLIILAAMERILRTEARARLKAEQLQLTLENMSQGIMLVTKDLQIPIINSRCGELLGLPPDFVEHPPSFDQLVAFQAKSTHGSACDPERESATPNPAATSAVSRQVSICERSMANGTVVEVRSGHLPDGSFVQTFTDITKRREAEAHVARLASEDPLTGLPNRRLFHSTLDQMCSRTGDTDAEFAVVFLDVDRFKVVNDTLGHRVGDMLLQEIALRLKKALQPADVLARLGGDEFAIVAPTAASRRALKRLAKRLIAAVNQSYEVDGHRIRAGVSIGIAVGPRDGGNCEDLLMAADLALYAAKASTRGTYRFYDRSMNQEVNDRRQLEMDLREAIEKGELELHYQPIIDLHRNVITGFEGLARWRHPTKGMVPPAVFIPVAEDTGLVIALGAWALAEACRAAASWPHDLKIAVNLSPVQLSSPDLLTMVKSVLTQTGLAPHRLELEITERVFIEDSQKILSTLHRLKKLGIRISMDDFGTGYSSLSYLRNFPYDQIKVDRAFVSDLAAGTEHIAIVQAVVSIARALGMTTTAEGVETDAQKEFLAALGCDEAQGYLFSAPVPGDKLGEIMAGWQAERTLAA
ncbi:MAG TPA: EAL domain-containing protein [Xanthobacteraceae bacterium]|jgi:diguanylate cyclase (GGDEF)-like protein